LPTEWIRRRKSDYYYRRAKEEDYRSRAAYKLLQAVEKYGFIKLNDVVVDLGAAPGGWLQAARKIVGERGFVLGVDIEEVKPLGYPNVYTIVGDVRDPDITNRIRSILPRPADAVISDVSPKISGVWELDHARQVELAESSLKIATSILRVNGNFFVKVFQGDMFNQFLNNVKSSFSSVKITKPKASRMKSAEVYVLGINYIKS
jgi:23S rRNA (uridine2552-2'-O)-methyltransferase